MYRTILSLFVAALMCVSSACAENIDTAHDGRYLTPHSDFSWLNAQLVMIERGVSNVAEASSIDLSETDALIAIRNAQTGCELMQGEFRWTGRVTRIPLGIRQSATAREAVRVLCAELARHKDYVRMRGHLTPQEMQNLEAELRNTRNVLELLYHTRLARVRAARLD